MRPSADGTHRLTVRATGLQLIAWGHEASRHSMSPAKFVAQAADFYVLILKAIRDAHTLPEEREEPRW
jgi:hypothetical protein